MIRDATEADIPWMIEMGERFAAAAGMTAAVGYDRASVEVLLRRLIDSDAGILLVDDGAMLGGLIYPHPFNSAAIVFQEMFWRAEQGGGVALLDEAVDRARAMGATHSAMMLAEALEPERTAQLYTRLGYRPLDRSFVKEL